MKSIRLMRHSTTIDGKNDVKNGKRATALAILAGAFDKIRNYTKAISSPMQRAFETADLVLQNMGLNLTVEISEFFAGAPANIAEYFHSDEFKNLAKSKNWTPEETLLSTEVSLNIQQFVKDRGVNGLSYLKDLVPHLAPHESAIIFTHSGSQIEPIAIAALRALNNQSMDKSLTFDELPGGMCYETESYVIEFDDDNNLTNVYKIGYENMTVVDLIKLAKSERL